MSDLDRLLEKTSRTFALAIPLLPEPCRREVGIAYLLFRIADTFEDGAAWPRAERIAALHDFAAVLKSGERATLPALVARWLARPPCDHAGYLELLRETPGVLADLDALEPGARAIVTRHAVRTAEGMAGVVARGDERGCLQLADVPDLQAYCYIVAGIVGELLTELFLHDSPEIAAAAPVLHRNAVAFGEGLQLVNILKDAGDDARDGRVYLPAGVDRARVIDLARQDLEDASAYVVALQEAGAPRGYLAFTALPVLLARATLDRLAQFGPGAKLGRGEVASLMSTLNHDLETGARLLANAPN